MPYPSPGGSPATGDLNIDATCLDLIADRFVLKVRDPRPQCRLRRGGLPDVLPQTPGLGGYLLTGVGWRDFPIDLLQSTVQRDLAALLHPFHFLVRQRTLFCLMCSAGFAKACERSTAVSHAAGRGIIRISRTCAAIMVPFWSIRGAPPARAGTVGIQQKGLTVSEFPEVAPATTEQSF